MKKGFSLVEVLISLITISLIMSAFAPVITKKVHTNTALGDGSKKSKPFPYNPLDPNCEAHENYIDCKFKTPDNVSRISAVVVSGGGGGAGATTGNKTTNQNAETSSGYKDIPITKHMKNVTITNLTGGGGGGGGGNFKNWTTSSTTPNPNGNSSQSSAPSESFCAKYNAVYIPAAYNGGGGKDLCVTKYNVGDGGITAPSGVVCQKTNLSITVHRVDNSAPFCYPYNGSYSACSRTVCNVNHLNSVCSKLTFGATKAGFWRLPTVNELKGWASTMYTETKSFGKIDNWKGNDGLQLCTSADCDLEHGFQYYPASYYGTSFCTRDTRARVFPNAIMSNTSGYYLYKALWSFTTGQSVTMMVDNGSNPNFKVAPYFASVRCVYDGTGASASARTDITPDTITTTIPHYTSAGGGAGSMGSRVSLVSIPDGIIQSAIGGKIRLTAGAGGTGGSKGNAGGTGGTSSISIYNASGSIIYQVSATGGNGGRGASTTTAGAGGSASNSCTGAPCSQQNNAGSAGTINADKPTSITSTGGTQSGSGYGAGGAGGSATGTSASNGIAGSAGHAKITYDLHYDGAAGGGGGGSSIIHIDNIPVTAGKEYTVRIGGGGKGGTINSNGNDGGESAIQFDGISCKISGGKGGKKGTSATATSNAIQGTGGGKGTITKTGTTGSIFLQKEGNSGGNGTATSNGSTGGKGGTSAGQTTHACGGLQSITPICSNGSINGETLPYETYGNIFKDGNYGIAGSGGGGGAWHSNTSLYPYPGTGGKGQNGYVYIYY